MVKVEPLKEEENGPIPGLHREEILPESGGIIVSEGPGQTNREYSGWDVYNNEAKKVDTELVNDWRDSLNSLLLFAAIFSAVLTAFIIESKNMLEQDSSEAMLNVMIFLTNNLANGSHNTAAYSPPNFEPTSLAITINCLFFASLNASLVAALASVVALQWVADYDAAIARGGSSPEDRAKRRQFRYSGVLSWKMNEIIAALPILLYFSVILFFAGLVLWMSGINSIVGSVVAGGAAIAVLFYGVTTTLSVIFVSAPFRTPLGRWIYSFVHRSFFFLYILLRALHIPFIPVWLEKLHLADTAHRKREDNELEGRHELAISALVWLANHLSISEDSYRRLLWLVDELPKLDPTHFTYSGFREAPWFSIFDLLGWINLKADPSEDISNEEMRAVATLARCYRISAIYDIIRPTESMMYHCDEHRFEYWSQYCGRKGPQWSASSRPTSPNSMFLLLRDIPLPSQYTVKEMEFMIRLSRWRNSQQLKALEETPRPGTPNPLTPVDHSFETIGRFLKANEKGLWFSRDSKTLYMVTVGRILRLWITSDYRVTPVFLDSLRWRFESLLFHENEQEMQHVACLSRPYQYRKLLKEHKKEFGLLHYDFTALLARNLHAFSGSERVRRIKEVITMIWVAPVDRHIPESNIQEREGFESFFDANSPIVKRWIEDSDEIRHILEILHHLATVQAEQPDIGPLWRVPAPRTESDPLLAEALKSFDWLMRKGVTPVQHYMLVDMVCRDIELGPPEAFDGYFNKYLLQDLDRLRDPCLRILGKCTGRSESDLVYFPFAEVIKSSPLEASWVRLATHVMANYAETDSPSIQELQAAMWPMIPNHTGDLCRQAVREPQVLTRLRCMFAYPVPWRQRYDSDGYLLLLLFEHIPGCRFFVDMSASTAIRLYRRTLSPLLMLLVLSDKYNEHASEELSTLFRQECLDQILDMIKAVEMSQLSFFSLLVHVSEMLVRRGFDYPEDLALFSVCVQKALRLPHDQRVASTISPIVHHARRLMDAMRAKQHGTPEDHLAALNELSMAVDGLNTHLAGMYVFGGQNGRLLGCARMHEAHSPAVGWLQSYVV